MGVSPFPEQYDMQDSGQEVIRLYVAFSPLKEDFYQYAQLIWWIGCGPQMGITCSPLPYKCGNLPLPCSWGDFYGKFASFYYQKLT